MCFSFLPVSLLDKYALLLIWRIFAMLNLFTFSNRTKPRYGCVSLLFQLMVVIFPNRKWLNAAFRKALSKPPCASKSNNRDFTDKKHRKCQGESHIGKRRLAMLTPVNWPPQGLSKNSFVGKLPLEPIQQLHDVACSFRWTSNCKGIAKLHRNHEALKRLFLLGRMLPRF